MISLYQRKEVRMRYYRVSAKCGHVGRNHYIVKNFYIWANDGKEAALKVRYLPRVKHDRKDAILSVEPISKEEYLIGKRLVAQDEYFKVHSSTEQRRCKADDYDSVFPEAEVQKRAKSKKTIYYQKLAKILRRDLQKQLVGEQ